MNWSLFSVGGAQTQKMGFVSSYLQLSTVWAYLLLIAQGVPCCCCWCRRPQESENTMKNENSPFWNLQAVFFCPTLEFSSMAAAVADPSPNINRTKELGHKDANALTFWIHIMQLAKSLAITRKICEGGCRTWGSRLMFDWQKLYIHPVTPVTYVLRIKQILSKLSRTWRRLLFVAASHWSLCDYHFVISEMFSPVRLQTAVLQMFHCPDSYTFSQQNEARCSWKPFILSNLWE